MLTTTNLLNCWHVLRTDNKFAELLTKSADVVNLVIEFADDEKPCRLGWIINIAKTLVKPI